MFFEDVQFTFYLSLGLKFYKFPILNRKISFFEFPDYLYTSLRVWVKISLFTINLLFLLIIQDSNLE